MTRKEFKEFFEMIIDAGFSVYEVVKDWKSLKIILNSLLSFILL